LLRPRNPHRNVSHSPPRNRSVLNYQIWCTSRASCRIPGADARFHSTPHVHFSPIHASFDLGGRKLKSGIKSGAAAYSESNETANRVASSLIRDRSEFAARCEPPQSCPGAVAIRWQPPYSCGGGARFRAFCVPMFSIGKRSESALRLTKRFSTGQFEAESSGSSTLNTPLIATSAEAPNSRNLELWTGKIRNRHLRNLFRLEKTPILCFVALTRGSN
jgi:hypothetical protein